MYSDVSGMTLQKDHAEFAEKVLRDKGFADNWEVVVAEDNELQIDYDDLPFRWNVDLPEQFFRVLEILKQALNVQELVYRAYASKGGNTHVVVKLPHSLPIMDRVAWQAAFGSDPVREALHINKRRDQKLLPAPEPVGRRFRTEESDAGQAVSISSEVSS